MEPEPLEKVDGLLEEMSTGMLEHLMNPLISADGGQIVGRVDELMAIRLEALSKDLKESMALTLRTVLCSCSRGDLDACARSSADNHVAAELTPFVSSPEQEGSKISEESHVVPDDASEQDHQHQLVALKQASLATTKSTASMACANPDDVIQFERLKDWETGSLTPDSLVTLVYKFHPIEELEDITEAFLFAAGNLIQQQNRIGIGLDGFERLKSASIIAEATHGVKRDLTLIQDALNSEQLHFMYLDAEQQKSSARHQVTGRKGDILAIIPAIVVVLQAIVYGVSADNAPSSIVWEILELTFTIFYFFEAAYKIYLLTIIGYFCGPERAWNLLDFGCLLLSLTDAIIVFAVQVGQDDLEFVVVLRLLRLGRLARLAVALRLTIFSELRLMLMGLMSGIRVLMWAVFLLFTLIYMMALVLNKVLVQEFPSVSMAMSTLFRCFTDGCNDAAGAPIADRVYRTYGAGAFCVYALLYVLVAIGVFNLFTALFIDNVFTTQAARKQRDLSDSRDNIEVMLQEALLKLVLQSSSASGLTDEVHKEIDSLEHVCSKREFTIRKQFQCLCDAGIIINCQQFAIWLEDENFSEVLECADVNIHNKVAMFEVLDADLGGSLTVAEVFHGIMKLRGPVTKADIIDVSLKVRYMNAAVSELRQGPGVAIESSTKGNGQPNGQPAKRFSLMTGTFR